MKKIVILLLFSFAPLLPSSGVEPGLPVTDVAHAAANIVGHAKSLTEAVNNGLALIKQFETMTKVLETMKKVKNQVDSINSHIYDLQSIVDAMVSLANVVQQTTEIYRTAARANVFSVDELIGLMDYLTVIVDRTTKTAETIKGYVKQNKWRFTDKERKDAIDAAADANKREEVNLEKIASAVESRVVMLQEVKYLNENHLIGPLDSYYANSEQELLLGPKLVSAFSKALGVETEVDTAKSATKKITGIYASFKNLFFVLSGFIALIGAYRVYRKVNLEEGGIGKAATIWFTSALTVFILGSVVEFFLL
ncbi:MAG: DUF4134 family protein [Prevotellaceae bacterium]|jgi:hypothetical protein|nr:DUF4134 family protein [Prevotellaceae bacterium]